MAQFNWQHPKQPEKKLPKDESKLPETKTFGWQKTKKLSEQEWDLTSFESKPFMAPAKKRKGGKQLTK